MELGKAIKEKRIEKGYSVEDLAKQLNISKATLYRYESEDITRIPVGTLTGICDILGMSIAELLGSGTDKPQKETELPERFDDPKDAIEFIVKLPSLAAFGGYDPDQMDDDTIVEFANDILTQIKVVSYKYKNL